MWDANLNRAKPSPTVRTFLRCNVRLAHYSVTSTRL